MRFKMVTVALYLGISIFVMILIKFLAARAFAIPDYLALLCSLAFLFVSIWNTKARSLQIYKVILLLISTIVPAFYYNLLGDRMWTLIPWIFALYLAYKEVLGLKLSIIIFLYQVCLCAYATSWGPHISPTVPNPLTRTLLNFGPVSLLTLIIQSIDFKLKKRLNDEIQKQEKLATLNKVITTLSHEINNPLTVAMGYTGKGENIKPGDLEKVSTALDRIAKIVKSINNFKSLDDLEEVEYVSESKMFKFKEK